VTGVQTCALPISSANGWNPATGLTAGTLVIISGVVIDQTPIAEDYNITGTGTVSADGMPKTVTIQPKSGKSPGAITVLYNGSTTAPSAVGTYTITFNVAAANGWNPATGLSAGTLVITSGQIPNQTPVESDYEYIGREHIYDGSPKALTIIPKSGKSTGAVTVYYNGNSDKVPPSAVGTYFVTFDVSAAPGWNAVFGLNAGTLTITQTSVPEDYTPVPSDYNISGLNQTYDGSPKTVTITPKSGKSPGAVTVLYNGSMTAPSAAGTYAVTFNVAAATGWKAATGLAAGTFIITESSISEQPFTSNTAFQMWLSNQPNNTIESAYEVKLNINVLSNIASVLTGAPNKYVKLDLTGSTFTSIGQSAFYNCSSIASVTIPSGVTDIGNNAFRECTNLDSISIPNNVTSIGVDAFRGCTKLVSITIGNKVTTIGNFAFYECSNLTSITIPNNVTSIGYNAFNGCANLSSIILPNNLIIIEIGLFTNCTKLTSISLPSGITSIGGNAFAQCSNLTSIIIPDSVTSIGENIFNNCSLLSNVTLGTSLISIGDNAFGSCTSLTSLTIPASVSSIGGSAFSQCTSLASVTFQGKILSSGFSTFYAFIGDLRDKFYATDSTNGTPGTYTRASGGSVWTLQQ
jgi:hypothetical protein